MDGGCGHGTNGMQYVCGMLGILAARWTCVFEGVGVFLDRHLVLRIALHRIV